MFILGSFLFKDSVLLDIFMEDIGIFIMCYDEAIAIIH